MVYACLKVIIIKKHMLPWKISRKFKMSSYSHPDFFLKPVKIDFFIEREDFRCRIPEKNVYIVLYSVGSWFILEYIHNHNNMLTINKLGRKSLNLKWSSCQKNQKKLWKRSIHNQIVNRDLTISANFIFTKNIWYQPESLKDIQNVKLFLFR